MNDIGQLCVPEWCFASVLSYMIYQMFFTRKSFRAMTASINNYTILYKCFYGINSKSRKSKYSQT